MVIYYLIFISLFVVLKIKATKGYVLCNDLFWLSISWATIVGVYLLADIEWEYPVSLQTWCYILLCFISFIIARQMAISGVLKFTLATKGYKPVGLKYKTYLIVAFLGMIISVLDFVRINGFVVERSEAVIWQSMSLIGVICNIFVPLLMVLGLYEVTVTYQQKQKISMMGILSILGYCLPVYIRAGRENFLYVGIALLSIGGYFVHKRCMQLVKKKQCCRWLRWAFVLTVFIFLIRMVAVVSETRFTDAHVAVYFGGSNVSESLREEIEFMGPFKNLYANFLWYFVHQLPFLELILRFYDGPYLLGMYELNLLSRRLPEFLQLDYTLVWESINNILAQHPASNILYSGWNTVIGSLYVDFWFFSPLICFILGYMVGCVRKSFLENCTPQLVVLNAVLCYCMFTTIQLGPIFSIYCYGAIVWWYVIFRSPFRFV